MALASQRDTGPEMPISCPTRTKLVHGLPTAIQPNVEAQYKAYQSLVDRAVEVFLDQLTASRWLSMPSPDLQDKVPLQAAQAVGYDADRMTAIFEPAFIRIEHGIFV